MSALKPTVQKAVDALVVLIEDDLNELHAATPSNDGFAVAMTLLRPYVRRSVSTLSGFEEASDKRLASFRVSAQVWETDGPEPELVGEADPVTVQGLRNVLTQLHHWIAELHGDEKVSASATFDRIVGRIATLRTTVTRGKGHGTFRIRYTADEVSYLCQADVKRLEENE